MHDRTRIAERYARGVAAAVAAVAALVLAANAGPAQSAERPPGGGAGRVGEVSGSLASAVRHAGDTWAPRPAPR
ncbi:MULTISPECIES: hypothetical protein [Streptomyces]|uniref:hypothetical protein n=1 Tax=Streptomyces TaxID=1883 RepID=UPI001CE334DE|nr:hypothetical protein [Streptomyces solaniscabiei]